MVSPILFLQLAPLAPLHTLKHKQLTQVLAACLLGVTHCTHCMSLAWLQTNCIPDHDGSSPKTVTTFLTQLHTNYTRTT